jgi:isoamylase
MVAPPTAPRARAPAEAAPAATASRSSSAPLGVTLRPDGAAFSLYARQATAVELLLFGSAGAEAPDVTIALDPRTDRTGPFWHRFVPGIGPGQHYGYRVDGPSDPSRGFRFDARQVLLDPYARAVAIPPGYRRDTANPGPGLVAATPKGVIVDLDDYDWEGDRPLERPMRDTIVYEAHVRGMTASPGSGVSEALRGTYRGFIEAIPYLVDLGVTAVELLPIHQFDAQAAPAGLRNYWGYQTLGFFAPHAAYAAATDAQGVVTEFRDLVKALHRAGLEVILDVVYNHTAEGGADGPTLSFRGLADADYYIHDGDGGYADFSGCGNTLDAGNPVVRRLILDSLRYWVREMHVDGFRFDLAAILSRDRSGRPLLDPPLIWDIDTDPELAGAKLIAEAWDAGGLYEVGRFPGDRWCEWNGRFRDDVRAFAKSDPGRAWSVAQRITASPDIYGPEAREPQQSINFVTCHDGFTLNDLVTYSRKHNEANGEGGRDGSDDNLSWNSGAEGPSDDPAIDALRARQVRNLLSITMLSMGVPMLLMGDEVRRTQGGNNNAYCHDDPTTWFDWTGPMRHRELLEFTRRLIALRKRLQAGLGDPGELSLEQILALDRITLSGVRAGAPDLSPPSRSVAVTIRGTQLSVHLICNAYWEALEFEVPTPVSGAPWRCVLDTSARSPDEIVDDLDAAPAVADVVRAGPRSVVCLVAVGAPGAVEAGART